ncbi:adenine phosphoribosyltransferase [Bowmanella sp. JS7-9]|uniref:Adenine phosphoribosyltransferase n=1 Tax=Pseudobowmanella zhangzhouensis TaxID=1537679 RepID=A0ABW1XIG3_9ALTE|nr:adenine phosphoribosyltransferase [Bowmanella sp. JS7-9]TBX25680.1 adenine phosphoribosyltransferase [Bowmanella sp. JS7-9]
MTPEQIKSSIRTIPDYPKPGIMFRDMTSLMAHPQAFQATIDQIVAHYKGIKFDKVVGTEARGFIFGAPLALALGVGFIPVRKPHKLPGAVISRSYQLEYGEDSLEIHKDAVSHGENVLLVDDLLATGGTIAATAELVRELGGHVEHAAFVVSLPELGGESVLEKAGLTPFALCQF